jgi:hypothetical protein
MILDGVVALVTRGCEGFGGPIASCLVPRVALAGCVVLSLFVRPPSAAGQQDLPPWEWSEAQIVEAVEAVRAGRSLNPESWPGGARVAVLLSFDVDNETIWLRNGDTNVGGLSQGQYGARVALGSGTRLGSTAGFTSGMRNCRARKKPGSCGWPWIA